jgi:hypothetical protein
VAARDALEDRVVDDDGGSGSGVGQRWMMTTMTTATAAVDDHGGAPPSPPAVPARQRARFSLPPGAVVGVRPTPPRLLAIEYCDDGGGQGGGEGHVDDGGDDEHVDGRVRGPRLADTGNGRRWRSRRDGDNDDDVEEGGSHPPTPRTTATR